ncbi:ATP-dependent nuclease subunit B [Campylobacter sp. VicNov18]|uniref:tetratricopeptide repeat protein n=1 Tax=Campylobacter bilis TaxID=2691918 RepID=UPI00130EDF6B|nr:ATP-dependent nuclease subunit B [Campylobacter bilis]MPV64030.1 ATP-dependent nuclease subunit B [Campylobacter hepaticus]MBM0637532.1 ATP-dependent nuclease subunit B [Campylobacter bilis]MCC8278254.1 ATP-dependent nuclease subunit B [Campylobacter bilis]MCC8299758.1 ATP-dependent nuclease subunit B [Campylobacter bilis]MCC8301163.1 ATP-dependent nuclease subunit B [Campylobacter bilis]
MYRNLLFVLIAFLLAACSTSQTFVFYPDDQKYKTSDFDQRVMKAYTYEYYQQYQKARDEFLALYQDYHDSVFLQNAFLLTLANNLDKQEQLNNLAKLHRDQNDNLKRLSALYALHSNNLHDAQKLMQDLLGKKDSDPRNLELYGDILVRKKDLKHAAKYYRSAYNQVQNEEILFKLIGVYVLLNDTLNIKNVLEFARKTNSCSPRACLLLAKIYFDEKNLEALEELYKELYELSHDKSFILALVELLNLQAKTQEALDLALQYDLDDDIKLALYQNLKRFDEANKISLKLYHQTKDKEYLLKSAIFEFESANASKKLSPKVIHSVKAKFEKAIQKQSNPLYLNYYGYLLIDYDLDVKKGIEFVKLALEKEPHNLYYLDSLAWGYYKLSQCDQAWELLKPVLNNEELANSPEGKAHIKAIKACINHDIK